MVRFCSRRLPLYPSLRQRTLRRAKRLAAFSYSQGYQATFDIPTPEIAQAGLITTTLSQASDFDVPGATLISNGIDIDHLQTRP